MSNIKNFEEFLNEGFEQPNEVVVEYSDKYPECDKFFDSFLKQYPTKSSFQSDLLDIILGAQEDIDEDMTDEDVMDEFWYPEMEIELLDRKFGETFCGEEIWVDFYNDLIESKW